MSGKARVGTRAAMLFGGAAVMAACSNTAVALYGAPYEPVDASADSDDAGAFIAMYGSPPRDAGADAVSDAPSDAVSDAPADANQGEGGPVPAYGAPGPDQ